MTLLFPSPKFDDAVAAVCHGSATEAEMHGLNALLRSSSVDWTLPNAAEQNHSVQEATVVGCVRAEGRWREKQALEFQSVNDRVRLAVAGDFNALTLSAWVCVNGLDRQFNSLFMSDGLDPGTIHWLIRNDGVLGLTVFGPAYGKFQILASPPVLSLGKLGMWQHMAVVIDGKASE